MKFSLATQHGPRPVRLDAYCDRAPSERPIVARQLAARAAREPEGKWPTSFEWGIVSTGLRSPARCGVRRGSPLECRRSYSNSVSPAVGESRTLVPNNPSMGRIA